MQNLLAMAFKAPSQIFDWLLNMPLQNTDSNSGKIKSASKKLNN